MAYYSNINRSFSDLSLHARVVACVIQEAWNNPAFVDTDYAKLVRYESGNATKMMFAVCSASDVSASYEYALNSGIDNPGERDDVVTDGMILSNVQAKWPLLVTPV
jgi:hypothetical protein